LAPGRERWLSIGGAVTSTTRDGDAAVGHDPGVLNLRQPIELGMSDSSEDEELEAIREQKREELLSEAGGDDSGTATDGGTDEPIHIDGADHLDSVLAEHEVVLADFYADWCGPCKMLAPTIEEIAAEENATVVKIDIDANQPLAQRFGVRGVPTVHLFRDGEPAGEWVGVKDKATYVNAIRAA
jgi:thioredoxin 1